MARTLENHWPPKKLLISSCALFNLPVQISASWYQGRAWASIISADVAGGTRKQRAGDREGEGGKVRRIVPETSRAQSETNVNLCRCALLSASSGDSCERNSFTFPIYPALALSGLNWL